MNEQAPRVQRPATYQDVLDAPPHMVAELVNGALHLHPRPAMRRARACFSMAGRLDDPFQRGVGGPGGWHFAIEPELHLGPDVLVPDLAGWRKERMGAFPDTAFTDLAPNWVCELLGPSTRRLDLKEKRKLYGSNGVSYLWFVDPEAKVLETFELRNAAWVFLAAFTESDEVRAAPFDAVGFPLSTLWPD